MSRSSCGGGCERRFALGRGGLQIVVGDPAQAEGEIADEMSGRNDLEHGQFGNRSERVRDEGKRRRARPGAFEGDVFKLVLDQLANSRGAVDVRNDLEQKIWCHEGGADRIQVSTLCLYPMVPVATRT